ncbi:hypothetical protein DYB32_002180 [Aphanomyces invadans]|uniref:Uncharacterized protein n=1 Tax=Aphanomyces invadans TaxID=157072 RepID=A0A3R6VEZ9_9STRA|nr:hypothetical protein DYB32_002180 [Aphanomyces invadans]
MVSSHNASNASSGDSKVSAVSSSSHSDHCKTSYAKNKDHARMKVHDTVHKEKLSAYGKEYYKRNRESELHRLKTYRAKNLGRDLERKKRWYARNRDRILAYAKAYDLKNRDKRNAYQRERRRRMKEQATKGSGEPVVLAFPIEPSMQPKPLGLQPDVAIDDQELSRRMEKATFSRQLNLSFLLNPLV